MIKDFAISSIGMFINLAMSIAWITVTLINGDKWWTWLWLALLLYWDFLIFQKKRKLKR